MNSLKSLFPDREGYVIMLTVLRKTRRDFMAENNFDSTVASLFKGMDAFISAKTVVGDAVTVKDTIILPLVDVSGGVGAGAVAGDKKNNAGGGMIKNQDTVTKILDMIPDVIDKFKGKDEKVVTDADIDEAIEDAAE